MREITIHENDANQRLDKFLQKHLNNLPKSLMYKYIRNKKIKVNNKRCQNNQILQCGDIIKCYIAEEFFEVANDDSFLKAKGQLNVVFEDENIIIMDKPSGLLTQSDINEQDETLVNQLKKYLYTNNEYDYQKEQSFKPALINRLDKNTSGLVIGAKNANSLRELNQLIKDGHIHKKYMTICCGALQGQGVWEDYHLKQNQKIDISSQPKKDYKPIKTGYEVIDYNQNYALVSVDLYTGKMHQIRAQFAHHHFPLLGDVRYGGNKFGHQYQVLRAYELTFNIPNTSFLNYLNNHTINCGYQEVSKIYHQLQK